MISNLFKSKPTLQELIPDGFVDIHSHILPGIDDGAKNVKESMELISKMKEMGFSKIIGTPHTYPGLYENTTKIIKDSFKKIELEKLNQIEVSYASEYFLDEYLIEMANNKNLLTLKNNYILIELGFLNPPLFLFEMIFKLCVNDYIPILAHPERYLFLKENFNSYQKLKNAGCKFQINLLSTLGYYGDICAGICDELIKNNLVDFVGSDVHKISHLQFFEKKVKINEFKRLEKIIENNIEKFG